MEIDWSLALPLYEVGLKPTTLFEASPAVQVLWDYLQPGKRIRPPPQIKPLKKVDIVMDVMSEEEQMAIRLRDMCREAQEHFICDQFYWGIAYLEARVERSKLYRNRKGFVELLRLAKSRKWEAEENHQFSQAIEPWYEGDELTRVHPWLESVYILPRVKQEFYHPQPLDPEAMYPECFVSLLQWRSSQQSIRYLVRNIAAYQYLDLLVYMKSKRGD